MINKRLVNKSNFVTVQPTDHTGILISPCLCILGQDYKRCVQWFQFSQKSSNESIFQRQDNYFFKLLFYLNLLSVELQIIIFCNIIVTL